MNTPAEVMLPDGSSFVMHVDGSTSHWTFIQCDLCEHTMLMEERFVSREPWNDGQQIWLCAECACDYPNAVVHVLDAPFTWTSA